MNLNRPSKQLVKIALLGFIAGFSFNWIMKFMMTTTTANIPLPVVVIQKPQLRSITEYITQTGTMVAYKSVDLVARIEGYLDSNEFTDGTFVKKGQELFVIEPKPYLEKLKSSQASVAVQKASYHYAKAEYARQQQMYKQNATSLNNVEKWAAQTDIVQAKIAKTVADAENASINYSYTHVLAPFDGRIGRHLVDPGNLVGNGTATDLATIEQIDPIYVYFNLNELDLIKLREAARTHRFKPEKIKDIPVYVNLQNETEFSHQGHLDFVNTGLNASTGTMELRALLPNKKNILLPGFFVQVRIPVGKARQQFMIPETAIQYDQISPYVLTVNQNNVVVVKRVVTGAVQQELRAIVKGLSADDNIVVSGLQNAIPGNAVTPILQTGKKT